MQKLLFRGFQLLVPMEDEEVEETIETGQNRVFLITIGLLLFSVTISIFSMRRVCSGTMRHA